MLLDIFYDTKITLPMYHSHCKLSLLCWYWLIVDDYLHDYLIADGMASQNGHQGCNQRSNLTLQLVCPIIRGVNDVMYSTPNISMALFYTLASLYFVWKYLTDSFIWITARLFKKQTKKSIVFPDNAKSYTNICYHQSILKLFSYCSQFNSINSINFI
jgi:hypothetical protein